MEQLFITNLTIKKVRHLKDISIPLSESQIKHLILTGKNGSGKTSVVKALTNCLSAMAMRNQFISESPRPKEEILQENKVSGREIIQEEELAVQFNRKANGTFTLREGECYVLVYYKADRVFQAVKPQYIEKIQLRDGYWLDEFPGKEFVKYLLDLKMTEALARNNGKEEKADEIRAWFQELEQLLKKIFADETIQLAFDEETFEFHILQRGKEPFDFNQMSSGYQAVLDIILDLMMRMQKQAKRSFDFNLPGIVLIDEIDAHLHLELQKDIMPFLTTMFPNIQFIVTSHSPFVLNSIENAVIYDLENHLLVENGLDDVPYEGIVEGYFGADKMSHLLKKRFERYKSLIKKKTLSDDEISEIAELELYLDEIPDYLAIGLTGEYQRLKLEFMNREDI